jgi:hypothetical protein
MRYRYTRAFIVEGTLALAAKSQEVTLFDEPGEGLKFVLTSAPDSFLMDADKTAAVGVIASSKWSVAGFPPPPPAKPPGIIVDEIRSNRKKLLDQRMVLVCQFDGAADPLKSHGPMRLKAIGFRSSIEVKSASTIPPASISLKIVPFSVNS